MRKIFTLLVGMLLLSSMSFAQFNSSFTLPTLTLAPGAKFSVPLKIRGLDTLSLLNFGFFYDFT